MSFAVQTLSPPQFRFSEHDPEALSGDKFRGLSRFGPYRIPALPHDPLIGFIFPKEYRDLANRLYLAIRNGIGSYRGLAATFRLPLEKDQVFQISNFEVPNGCTHHSAAEEYANAVRGWIATRDVSPDLFIVLHRRSPSWLGDTPYYRSKSLLLREGFLSQDVTIDLLTTPSQFEWAAANIALAMFVKLGGVPWVLNRRRDNHEIVIGVGRSELRDPVTRQTKRTVAFTTCIRGDGPYLFSTVAEPAATREQYLESLHSAIKTALTRLDAEYEAPYRLTLHVPKAFGKDEATVIDKALAGVRGPTIPVINILQITAEEMFFAIDRNTSDGIPAKGTCIQLGDDDFLLYTEGRDERRVWRGRLPTAIRVRQYGETDQVGFFRELLSQVLDLSQVNYRGFNATSFPASIRYSELTARLLSHIDFDRFDDLCQRLADGHQRMWFL